MSEAFLIWSMVFSVLGLAYFSYGRRRSAFVPLLCGVAMMAFPYLVSGTLLLVAIGTTLTLLPLLVRW